MKLLLLMFLSLATTLAHDPLDYDDYTTDVKATDDGNSTGSLGARGHRQMTGRRDRFNNPSFNPSAIGTSRYGRRRGPTTTTQEVEVKVEQPDSGGCKHISEEMGVLCPNGCSLKTELLKQETNIRGIVRDLKPQVAKLSESSNSIYTRVNHMHNSLRERQRVEDGNVNVMGQYNGRVEDQHNYIKEMVDTFFPSNMRVMQGVLDRIRQKIQKLEKAIRIQMDGCSEPCTTRCPVPVVSGMECEDIFRKGGRESQMYLVRTDPSVMPYRVFCDQTTENGGWLLIQNRLDGSVDFGRRWDAYRSGFGNIAFDVGKGHCETAGEYWLGLDRISDLTKTGQTEVLFEMQDWTGAKVSAKYKKFTVQSKLSNFVLAVDEYSGNAGNGLLEGSLQLFGVNRTMTIHNGMMFSTYDRDNDNWNPGDPSKQCSREDGGGWWYNRCHSANPNGRYYIGGEYTSKMAKHGTDDGMVWMNWKGSWYSLKTMSIKIRPVFN